LLLAIVVNATLFIDFGPQILDETDVSINSAFVVFVHAAFVLIESAKVLLHAQQSVL
jgi:hypothetical protein